MRTTFRPKVALKNVQQLVRYRHIKKKSSRKLEKNVTPNLERILQNPNRVLLVWLCTFRI